MNKHLCTITPTHTNQHYLSELWRFRELFWQLTWKEILVRFRQTYIGFAWLVLRPFMLLSVLVLVFSFIARFPSGDLPYPVFLLSALIPWQFITAAIQSASSRVVQYSGLVNKVYFPRVIIPLSSVGASTLDFAIALVLLFGFMACFGYFPILNLLLLPFMILWGLMLISGVSFWIGSIGVFQRDVLHAIPILSQLSLYLSPVIYPTSCIPYPWRYLFALNPLAGYLEAFRWVLLGSHTTPDLPAIIVSLAFSVFIFLTGFWFFRKQENIFADII